eukprot:6178896-Pleurochrysis_carterae.AAC.2
MGTSAAAFEGLEEVAAAALELGAALQAEMLVAREAAVAVPVGVQTLVTYRTYHRTSPGRGQALFGNLRTELPNRAVKRLRAARARSACTAVGGRRARVRHVRVCEHRTLDDRAREVDPLHRAAVDLYPLKHRAAHRRAFQAAVDNLEPVRVRARVEDDALQVHSLEPREPQHRPFERGA